jgi:hypothetical protein
MLKSPSIPTLGFAPGVARPENVMERAVVSADRRAERVIPFVQRFAGDAPLDGDVDGRELGRSDVAGASARAQAVILAAVHVAIHRHVFVAAPARRDVIDDDVADGFPPSESLRSPTFMFARRKRDIADDIVCFEFDGVAANANAVAGAAAPLMVI